MSNSVKVKQSTANNQSVEESGYLLNESIVSPVNMKKSNFINEGHRNNQNLGKFARYQLSKLVLDSQYKSQKGRIIKLASVQNKSIAINNEAIQLFDAYRNNEIAFVGNFGKDSAGKSYWYDKILDLSDFPGNYYSQSKKDKGLYIWSVPFTKQNLKIFLIDYVGGPQSREAITEEDRKLLDLELLLVDKMVVVADPQDKEFDYIKEATQEFKNSRERLSQNGNAANKQSKYWPSGVYVLYRSAMPIKRKQLPMEQYFEQCNFSIIHDAIDQNQQNQSRKLLNSSIQNPQTSKMLNETYVMRTSLVFQDIYNKIQGKQYSKVSYNGKNLPFILSEASKNLNQRTSKLNVNETFLNIKKKIYDNKVKQSTKQFKQNIELQKLKIPVSLDILTDKFQNSNRKIFLKYDEQKLDPNLHSQYEQKLRKSIDEVQKKILDQNVSKTDDKLSQKLPDYESSDKTPASINAYVTSLSKQQKYLKKNEGLDHKDTIPVQKKLKAPVSTGTSIHLFTSNSAIKQKQLNDEIQKKKKELEELKKKNLNFIGVQIPPDHKQLIQKQKGLDRKLSQLRDQKQVYGKSGISDERKKMQDQLNRLKKKNQQYESQKSKIKQKVQVSKEEQKLRQNIQEVKNMNQQAKDGLNKWKEGYNKSLIKRVEAENIKKIVTK